MTNQKSARIAVRKAMDLLSEFHLVPQTHVTLALKRLRQAVCHLEEMELQAAKPTADTHTDCEPFDGGPDEGYRDAS